MKVSILDLSPIASSQSPKEALQYSARLAQAAEALGYQRFWVSEHHDLPGLASSAPEVLISYIGAQTKTIRLGSGAVLLPHYKPYKVAEVFHTLETLFPGRIDVGVGRAPGGSAEATNALNNNFLQKVANMPELVEELLHFLYEDFPDDHPFHHVQAAPVPNEPPVPWLLGTSKKSAALAAEKGIGYVFGEFMSNQDGKDLIKTYKNNFSPLRKRDTSYVIVTVSAVCAETTDKAEAIAQSALVWGIQRDKGEGQKGVPAIEDAQEYPLTAKEKATLAKRKQKMFIGDSDTISNQLQDLAQEYQADEIMINTVAHDIEHRIQSYEQIAQALSL
ncbi:luciferase family oxidoreductase, group 1 [Alteribacillus persepolensis]|uniref:Luciferase family oxidoreductase, group 1 n=1 Tax=Alteribacillus persepolensis TaxID=568899 RepID=A0A1G8JWY4_9BACI|nr:LLM class flavin-dependent oxidoreductase [Alteribacillus persepolensis]SDI35681.1 luciferase family oxidoreductase, group 1 [Alteribacillus persepolensis]